MTNRLMVSVAAIALIAGAGFAHAQGAGTGGHESSGAAMQGGATGGTTSGPGSSGSATMNRDGTSPSAGGSKEMKSSQSEQKGSAKGQHAEDNMRSQKSKSMSSENETKGGSKEMKAEGRDSKTGTSNAENREGRSGTNMNAQSREGASGTNMNAQSREGGSGANMNAQTKTGTDRSQVTTGQAGAGAKLSTEQRTKISSVIRSQHVESLNNVNFSVSVGTRVPRDIHFRPLPTEVVSIYPEWRGFDFIVVHDRIVVIDPNTYEIVAVLDA
ncbi:MULTISPECIES: DUF1236 domain-containing protein [unclassified Bradyrhizobium]|uniref:DUF1236 domain-containing protein n=1 Tax=unclassified Bradyrhizobium TaxID=2631580 RepID=UPI002915EFD4|nr:MULTISPECIES: DUF1236 domain-containing protein [unclassified Bradyrhizobium]